MSGEVTSDDPIDRDQRPEAVARRTQATVQRIEDQFERYHARFDVQMDRLDAKLEAGMNRFETRLDAFPLAWTGCSEC